MSKMRDKYFSTVINYSRKYPSASDKLVEQMVNRQFTPTEIKEAWESK